MVDKLGKTSSTDVSAVDQRLIQSFGGSLQAQVHFTYMPDYAFTVDGLLLLTANPIAFRGATTRLLFDSVLG